MKAALVEGEIESKTFAMIGAVVLETPIQKLSAYFGCGDSLRLAVLEMAAELSILLRIGEVFESLPFLSSIQPARQYLLGGQPCIHGSYY